MILKKESERRENRWVLEGEEKRGESFSLEAGRVEKEDRELRKTNKRKGRRQGNKGREDRSLNSRNYDNQSWKYLDQNYQSAKNIKPF